MKEIKDITNFVLAGSWNKAIFTEDWVKKYILDEYDKINIRFPLNPDLSLMFITDDFSLRIVGIRLEVAINKCTNENYRKVIDKMRKLAQLLPHTPVFSFGINHTFSCNSIEVKDTIYALSDESAMRNVLKVDCNKEEIVERKYQITDKCNLIFKVEKILGQENNDEFRFHFNYDYPLKEITDMTSIFGDENDLIIQNREHALRILSEVYKLELK